jgi:mono/diheme cytochrome c family protein
MTKLAGVLLTAAVMSGVTSDTAPAQRSVTMPPETAVYGASGLPGYPLVQRHCVTCHSAHVRDDAAAGIEPQLLGGDGQEDEEAVRRAVPRR